MKVLFIGEGRHDIGDPNPNPYHPRLAQGTVPTLVRRVCPAVSLDSVALAWTEIPRFNPAGKKAGYPAKIAAAALLAVRKHACAGTVVVADREKKEDRQLELEEGVQRSAEPVRPSHMDVSPSGAAMASNFLQKFKGIVPFSATGSR